MGNTRLRTEQQTLDYFCPKKRREGFIKTHWMPLHCKSICHIKERWNCSNLRKYLKIQEQIYNLRRRCSNNKEQIIDLHKKARDIIQTMKEDCPLFQLKVTRELREETRKENEEFYEAYKS